MGLTTAERFSSKAPYSVFSKKMTIGDGELSSSPSCKTVSHLVPMNTVFLTESLK
jgi:hypothetical protein